MYSREQVERPVQQRRYRCGWEALPFELGTSPSTEKLGSRTDRPFGVPREPRRWAVRCFRNSSVDTLDFFKRFILISEASKAQWRLCDQWKAIASQSYARSKFVTPKLILDILLLSLQYAEHKQFPNWTGETSENTSVGGRIRNGLGLAFVLRRCLWLIRDFGWWIYSIQFEKLENVSAIRDSSGSVKFPKWFPTRSMVLQILENWNRS